MEAYLIDGTLPAQGATCPGLPIPAPVPVAGDPSEPRSVAGGILESLERLAGLVGALPL